MRLFEKIADHGLEMKLVDVEYTFDRSKVFFILLPTVGLIFGAGKDLAAIFRTRIELRQIGVRDEAKMIGDWGPAVVCFAVTPFR